MSHHHLGLFFQVLYFLSLFLHYFLHSCLFFFSFFFFFLSLSLSLYLYLSVTIVPVTLHVIITL